MSPKAKLSPYLELRNESIQSQSQHSVITKEARARAEQLATFLEDASDILDKHWSINRRISLVDLRPARRKLLLADLTTYQTRRGRAKTVIMVFFLITVLLGLVAMTVEQFITSVGMYGVWGVLLGANMSLAVGYLIHKRFREDAIVREYSSGEIVLTNPNTREDAV